MDRWVSAPVSRWVCDFASRLGVIVLACGLLAGTARAEPMFSAREVREDLAAVRANIAEIHPDPAHSVDPAVLDRAFRKLNANIRGPMTRAQAWGLLARLNAVMADGHLSVAFADTAGDVAAYQKAGGGFFPYEVTVSAHNEVRVVSLLGGTASERHGQTIASIQGRDARVVVAELLERVAGDTPTMRRALLSARWPVLYWRLYGRIEHFRFAFARQPDRVIAVEATRVLPSFLADQASFERTYQFQPRANGVAVMKIGAFWWEDKPKFFDFMRAAFTRLHDEKARCLIIDIRGNTGGDDDMWRDGVLRYLADKPYRWGSTYIKRVMAPYADAGETVGAVVTGEIIDRVAPGDEAPRFTGKTVVMIGPSTYSSSILFANTAQDYRFARLAGEGGAVRAKQSGGIQRRVLPHTGLINWVPRFVLKRPSGATVPAHVTPDIAIADDPLDPTAAIERAVKDGCD